jgi:hypothetical protein
LTTEFAIIVLTRTKLKMDREKELRAETWAVWKILINAKECYFYSHYLHQPETELEKNYVSTSMDFRYMRDMMWRMSLIELSKLFSESKNRDRYNLLHFLSKLKNDGHFGAIGIADSKREHWEQLIAAHNDIIGKVLTLRDKVYAHTDSETEILKQITLSFPDIQKLIGVAEEIIQGIYGHFGEHADMEPVIFDKRRFNILKILANEREDRIQALYKSIGSKAV